jgi:hypothetical protein
VSNIVLTFLFAPVQQRRNGKRLADQLETLPLGASFLQKIRRSSRSGEQQYAASWK